MNGEPDDVKRDAFIPIVVRRSGLLMLARDDLMH